MMGEAYTIPHEHRPAVPAKKDNGFSPIEDMSNSMNSHNEMMDQKWEHMKNNMDTHVDKTK